MLLEQSMLHTFIQLSGSRSAAAAYHLITGRSSIQTKQDVHLFQLGHLYGICPTLKKQEFDRKTNEFLKNGWITVEKGERELVIANETALERLKELPDKPFAYLNGIEYGKTASIFGERLILLIQTVANMAGGNNRFMAVSDNRDVANWVRRSYKRIRGKEKVFLDQLYGELLTVLERLSDGEAEIFTARLSGYNHYGQSLEQLARLHQMKTEDVQLLLTSLYHELLRNIDNDKERFPILAECAHTNEKHVLLADSTTVTRDMLSRGMSVSDIASYRMLKENTIQDHIVEIALHDLNFDLTPYLSKADEEKIQRAIRASATGKLREIKESLDEEVDYFQIRLALARLKQKAGD